MWTCASDGSAEWGMLSNLLTQKSGGRGGGDSGLQALDGNGEATSAEDCCGGWYVGIIGIVVGRAEGATQGADRLAL